MSPQAFRAEATNLRARTASSVRGGNRQEAKSRRSRPVLPIINSVTSSSCSMVPSIASRSSSHTSTGVRPAECARRCSASSSSPTSSGRVRFSTSPSVNSSIRQPGGNSTCRSRCWASTTPSGGPRESSSCCTLPSASTHSGGRCPALAIVIVSSVWSCTAYTQVAMISSGSSQTSWFRRAISSLGGRSITVKARIAVRSWPITAAAGTPRPITSPITKPVRPPGREITSNQSPPTPPPPARYW